MSWAIAANWLAVVGLLVLTFGTGAQAISNLAEFRYLKSQATMAAISVIAESIAKSVVVVPFGSMHVPIVATFTVPPTSAPWYRRIAARLPWLRKAVRRIGGFVSYPARANYLRERGGEEAVQVAKYLRTAKVWAIIMIGSALALLAAVIQLALAYQ
jgi:hypothetical protein